MANKWEMKKAEASEAEQAKLAKVLKQRVADLIQEAGQALESKNKATANYNKVRTKLAPLLEKAYGTDVWMQVEEYEAAVIVPLKKYGSVTKFLQLIKDDPTREKLLTVSIGKTETALSEVLVNKIIKASKADTSTLFIRKIQKGE